MVLCNLYSSYDRNFMCYLYECKFQAGFITTFVKDWKNPMCITGDLHDACAQQLSSLIAYMQKTINSTTLN